MYIFIFFILLLNVIGFAMMGIDKKRSQKGKWRIPERRLWLIGVIGGGFGLYWGMKRFHHKTKHKSFVLGIPLVCLLNLVIYGFAIYYNGFILK